MEKNEGIQHGLRVLMQHEAKLGDVCAMMLKAGNHELFALDFLFVGAIHRVIKVSMGFRALIDAGNFICAAPLVRLQLDSVLRLFAASLVDDKGGLLERMLDNEPISRIKDRDGKRMTDTYLVEKLSKQPGLETLRGLYKRTSGFVHFSDIHVLATTRNMGSRNWRFAVGGRDYFFPDSVFLQAISAVHDMINEKDPDNPVQVVMTEVG